MAATQPLPEESTSRAENRSRPTLQLVERSLVVYGAGSRKVRLAFHRAKTRIRYVVEEFPFRVIAGAFAISLVAGVALRIWRSKR